MMTLDLFNLISLQIYLIRMDVLIQLFILILVVLLTPL